MSWFEDKLAEEMKDPEFKALWERDEPVRQIVDYLLDNNIPFTQEFLNILDELTEKGVTLELVPIKEADKAEIHEPALEYA
ncbi:MAG: hypothetical protein IJI57_17360 [Flexilinea sp.]|nr:hypothetical protein [Flexilinea sp.]